MSKATETQELPKEEKAAPGTSEAKQEREGNFARREAKRRERSLEMFNEERWSREATLSWIARRDPHGMNRSLVSAVFHDRDLPGREPRALLTEATADKKIGEYNDGRRTWYRSEQVKAAFPVPDRLAEKKAEHIKSRPRGRTRKIPQERIDEVAFELFEENGDLSDDDPDWHTQGQIENATRAELARKFGKQHVPKESTLRVYVVRSIEKWRRSQGR